MKGYHYCKWLIANPYCQENMLKWKWKVKVIIIFLHYSNVKIRKSSDFVLLVWYLKQVDTKIQKVNSQKLVQTKGSDTTVCKFGLTIYCCSIRNIPITNEKVFKYQSAGDKTIEIVESAKLPHQDTWHLPLATWALARRTDSSEDMCFSFERSAMNDWPELIHHLSK